MNSRIFFALFVVLALLCAPVFSTEFDSDVDVDVDVEAHVEHEVESTHEVDAEHEVDVESAAEHWVDMEVEGSSSSTGAAAPSSTGLSAPITSGSSTGVAAPNATSASYLAIPRGAVNPQQIACVKKQGIKVVAVSGVSKHFSANAKIIRKAGLELHAFYTPKDATADFIANATAANATRVWIRVDGKYYEDKNLKLNFQNVIIAAKELTRGPFAGKVGIYASKKSWTRIMGAKVNGGALRVYPLWLASGKEFAGPKRDSAKSKFAKLAKLTKTNGQKAGIKRRSFLEMETPPAARKTQGKPVNPKAARQAAITAAKAAAKSAKAAPVTGTVFDKAWVATIAPATGKAAGNAVCGLPADLSTGAATISTAVVGAGDAPVVGSSANPIVAAALSLTGKGTKYLYGGDGKNGNGIDCSHFVQSVYAKAGKVYPFTPTASWPAKQFVRTTTPQAGDIIMFPGHMAIYQDAKTMIGSQSSTGPAPAACPGPYWGSSKGKPISSYWTWRG